MKFGINLKKLRKSKKLSQEDLADRMKVSRQSVSKWENGDAYPEMNNLLELCKIFHCHINDLVNDSIVDMDSLDEEIIMNVVKFKTEQQNKMKFLSKAITIIAKIGRIACTIIIPVIVISMILLGFIIHKVNITDNEITWTGKNTISIIESDNKVSLKINNELVSDITNGHNLIKIKEVLQNNSKIMVLHYVETGLMFLIVSLILIINTFKALENLFNNINKGDTPFTLENIGYIKKMAYLLIAVTVFPNIIGVIFEIILKMDLNFEFRPFNLVEILFLFSISLIFQYGYEIQLDSKGKMYGDELT